MHHCEVQQSDNYNHNSPGGCCCRYIPRPDPCNARPYFWDCQERIRPQPRLLLPECTKYCETVTKKPPGRSPSPKTKGVTENSIKKEKPPPKDTSTKRTKPAKLKGTDIICRCSQCLSQGKTSIRYTEDAAICHEAETFRCYQTVEAKILMAPVKVLRDDQCPEKAPLPICRCNKERTEEDKSSGQQDQPAQNNTAED